MDNISQFLEAIRTDKARELMKKMPIPKNEEETLAAYQQIAGELGCVLTPEELERALREAGAAQAARTAQAEAKVAKEALTEDALESVAGGDAGSTVKDHPECEETFSDYEWCWFTDSCQLVISYYDKPSGTLDTEKCYWSTQDWGPKSTSDDLQAKIAGDLASAEGSQYIFPKSDDDF